MGPEKSVPVIPVELAPKTKSGADGDGAGAPRVPDVPDLSTTGRVKGRRAVRWLFVAVSLVIAGGGAAWYTGGQGTPPANPAIAIVSRRDLSATVVATGTIKAVVGGEVKVGSRIPGRVERLAVQVGDRVRPGQMIATLEQDELRATLEKTRAELAAAEARAAQVAADLAVVRATADTAVAREMARLSAARARLKLVLDGARPEEIAQAEAAVRQAEANVRLAEANAARSRRLLDQALI